MRLPGSLRKLDDRVLGNRLTGQPPRNRDRDPDDRDRDDREQRPARTRSASAGLRGVLSVVYRVSRLVFLVLALIMIVGIVFTVAPTNPENSIVQNVLELAERVAGPFKDVFTQMDDPERQTVINYGFAAVVFVIAATVVRKLPLPGGKG